MRVQHRSNCCAIVLVITVTFVFAFFTLLSGPQRLTTTTTTSAKNVPSFGSTELELLRSFNDLLYLEGASENVDEILFATRDKSAPISWGRLRIYRIENSTLNEYIIFHWLNNEIRAVHGLQTVNVTFGGLSTSIPRDVVEFGRKWRNGQFIGCLGLNVSDDSLKQHIDESFVKKMAQFRDFIERYNSTPFLLGGTLLGWYRECAFIRDTTDVDFGMKIAELDESMLNDMQHTKLFKLYWILGKVNDSLELSVYAGSIKIDLFFVFHGEENDWVGGMIVSKKEKLKWIYPRINKLCVGDLYGILFNVPCNVEEIVEADYGANWTIPHRTSSFVWYSSHKNVRRDGYWERSEWSSVQKVFT